MTRLSNVRCSVAFSYTGLDDDAERKARKKILSLLDDALAIEQKGSYFNPTVQSGLWDGRRHVFHKNDEDGTFPAGVERRVKSLLREAGYRVMRTVDRRVRRHQDGVNSSHEGCEDADVELEVSDDMLAGVTLRDDQLRVITAALENGCGLLHVATGGGKTEIAAAIIKALNGPLGGRRCLFLVHTKQLLKQGRERLALRLGTIEEHIGIIGDGRFDPKHITVATVQSLTRSTGDAQKRVIAKYLKTIDLLILDETHHVSAKTFYRLVQRIDAPWRYGMSGTPFGLADGKGLMVEAAFGPVVERVTNEELIQLGVNARPTIRMLEVTEPKLEDGDWHFVYKTGIVLNEARNEMIVREAETFASKGWPTLIIVRELWHGDRLAMLLRDRKVAHAFVHGQMPTDEVERHKDRLKDSSIHVLIASPIFGEGVDIPAVRALIIADGGQSVAAVLQKIGRGLRRKQGDNRLDVVDFADLTHKWLSRHSQERLALYEGEGFAVVT